MTGRFCFLLLFFLYLFNISLGQSLLGQRHTFTRADTLRGSLLPERACYDVTYYDLALRFDTAAHSITGSNTIAFRTVRPFAEMQIDLFANMAIINITMEGKELRYRREYNAVFVEMPRTMAQNERGRIIVNYYGKPTVAKRAPWDGGFVWSHDNTGKFWAAVACEGMGASLWMPCKDYLGDEPDSMRMRFTIPDGLQCIANGQSEGVQRHADSTTTFTWFVSYPLNTYNATFYIGNYVHWHDTYAALDGDTLALDYYVLPYNLQKSKQQFEQVKPMLRCYEQYLGKYPFWRDGYKLVESPYLGMEHQSAIAYGNQYKTGYAGIDFSRIGLDFDYIIVHESAHEWWGNSVSCRDLADMWIHESFATYTEAIYVQCTYGEETALRYINAKKPTVENKTPIVGVYGVNEEGSGDMYNKGMLFLNTLRHVVNNDSLWWRTIKGMSDTVFKMKNIGYEDVVTYFTQKTGLNLSPIFAQYLKFPHLPVFDYKLTKLGAKKYELACRWVSDVPDFQMPVWITEDGKNYRRIEVTDQWKTLPLHLTQERNFGVNDTWMYFAKQKESD